VLDDAEPVIDRWARRIREKQAGHGPAGRARYIEEQVERLADTGLETLAPIERESMLADMAQALGVPGRLVADAYQRARTRGRRAADPGEGAVEFKPGAIRAIDRFRVHAVACLLEPAVATSADRARTGAALLIDIEGCPPELAGIVRAAADAVRGGSPLDAGTLLAMAPGERLSRVLAEAFARAGEADAEELDACVRRLEEHGLREAPKGAGGAAPVDDRLARLRSLHKDFGGNHAANPYRRGGGTVRPPRGAAFTGDDDPGPRGQSDPDDEQRSFDGQER
jgi:hypothetical protein